ncbi:NotI family restriction endonuclease [Paraburkholderia tropica]|uniref:NotI family restriction endonuclease n=1 Tax=Paraburkholderia tropica TaxID=92647 RepID=UPI002AB20182|nr:NotI family restriction endonuclease [Paraburkholderia tropica]
MTKKPRKPKDITPRFGIGEWYGLNLAQMTPAERQYYAAECLKPKKQRTPQPCPFQARKADAICSKNGGVCSLRQYSYTAHAENGRAVGIPVTGKQGDLRATCPYRFHEALDVFKWVGEKILDDPNPTLVGEVGFLEAGATTDNEGGDDVGRIDMVLVSNKTVDGAPMKWAALEIQAVYFSGNAMKGEFEAFNDTDVDWLIFPAGRRRPDYRSSGPKRLMPQLQIKVPTLRRWGKKMAVVVDRAFFDSIGEMDDVPDISNADIAWFIVRFEEVEGEKRTRIVRDEVRYTTLERSVEGLTGGKPVSLPAFETRITEKVVHPSLNQDDPYADQLKLIEIGDASAAEE